jgi:predicted N-acetyltransferase YhbS
MTDEFRLVRTDERTAMFELRARAFERGSAAEWASYVEADPWRDHGADLVAVSNGRVVATLRVEERQVAGPDSPGMAGFGSPGPAGFGDKGTAAPGSPGRAGLGSPLRMAGFGAVASDPTVRGQGYIRRLLALAHQRNVAAGYHLAMLFTGSPWVYSGSAGFSGLPLWWLDLDPGRLPAPAGQWTIAPADPDRYLPGMRQVYDAFGHGRPGYPLRDDAYWTHPARLTDAGSTRVALDRGEQVVAYVRLRLTHDGRAIVQECPYVSADAASALMADVAHGPIVAQSSSLGGRLPRDHVLGAYGQWHTNDSCMVRAYTDSGRQLLEAMHDAANQRSVYWSGDGF